MDNDANEVCTRAMTHRCEFFFEAEVVYGSLKPVLAAASELLDRESCSR